MAIDYSLFAIPKHTPAVVTRAAKQKAERKAWRKTKKAVDTRDARTDPDSGIDAPTCFITGKRLQNGNYFDAATFRDRAHLDARSTHKSRRYDSTNVISVSRLVHLLIDRGVLLLFNKRGTEAKTVRTIDHVAWNRRLVAKGEEPCRIRKGLAVLELP